jgi:hypothetical protein
MSAIQVFTNEDVFGNLAHQLRTKGLDAVSTPESSRLRFPDESRLEWSTSQGRVLFSFNVRDFARIHHEVLARGESHSGIVVSKRFPVGIVVLRLLHLAETLDAEGMIDRLEFLSDW